MGQRRFSVDGEAYTTRGDRGVAAKEWLSLLLPLLAIVGLLAGFWLLYQAFTTPAPVSPMLSAARSSGTPPLSTYPPELLTAAIAVSTFLAPTPTPLPPTPTYAALATSVPIYCGMNSQVGEACRWPAPTPALPTPLPVCLTPMPSSDCRWMGSMAGTPIAITGAGSGYPRGI